MLGGAASGFWRQIAVRMIGHLLQAAQAVVDRRLGQLHAPRELAKVELRVRATPAGHLTQRGRQAVELSLRFEPVDRSRLPQTRTDGLADVGGLEVEATVHLSA